MEALWAHEPSIIAYSEQGYRKRIRSLPEKFKTYEHLELMELTINGDRYIGFVKPDKGQITLSLNKDQGIIIRPKM